MASLISDCNESRVELTSSSSSTQEQPQASSTTAPTTITSDQSMQYRCEKCSRTFGTKSGRTNHQNRCKAIVQEETPQETIIVQQVGIPPPSLNKIWGNHCLADVEQIVSAIYEEIVFWRQNIFMLPSGSSGKCYVREMTRLIEIWNAQAHPLKDISLKVLMVMPALLLQKPSYKSKSKQHSECLKRRLEIWMEGDLNKLVVEARTIQSKLSKPTRKDDLQSVSKSFAKLMLQGKVNSALRLLDKTASNGVLGLSEQTLQDLRDKHPNPAPPDSSILIRGEAPFVDPVLFSNIDESLIAKVTLRTKGAAGPSGMNADGWRKILISKNYGRDGVELRKSIATMARTLATKQVDTSSYTLEPYTACRLIPLDKNPGVRPIGIGEVLRRIVGKSIIMVTKPEIMDSAGSLQLCAGLPAGCEGAAHAMSDIFMEEATDALLLVDAENAFNSLNRSVLLHNISYICPALAMYVKNCYKTSSRLFVMGGKELSSREGTTQGDPLAMPAYAIGIVPLLPLLKDESTNTVKHAAYADDLAGAGTFNDLLNWWKKVEQFGPRLGYYPKASKSWLIVKDENNLEHAREIFKNTQLKITHSGRKYLGTFIGKEEAKNEYIDNLVSEWVNQVRVLSDIAKSEPQAAYAAFTSGYKHRMSYHIRTTPNISDRLKPLDDAIDQWFIPTITEGHHCTVHERQLLSLPVKLGGMGIPIFQQLCETEYNNSTNLTKQTADNIKQQTTPLNFDAQTHFRALKTIRDEKVTAAKDKLQELRNYMSQDELRANDLAQMQGASSWLTSLPLESENFVLNKREFYDTMRMRYRWQLKYLPSLCACGKEFTVDHALLCQKGGYIHARHDELRDVFVSLGKKVSNDVESEPHLQPLTGEQLPKSANGTEEARLDLSIRGFWQRGQRAFFDVRVFNPFAPFYRCQKLESAFASNEKEKKRTYGRRVTEVEHGSFTPLVFSSSGGCARESGKFLSVLAMKISDKQDVSQCVVMNWLRTVVSYSLLRSAILCVRGSRNAKRKQEPAVNVEDIELFMT